MKKKGKNAAERKNGTQQSVTKTAPKIVTGSEIPNLLKKRPFKIRFY
jgi:hypothetical protein